MTLEHVEHEPAYGRFNFDFSQVQAHQVGEAVDIMRQRYGNSLRVASQAFARAFNESGYAIADAPDFVEASTCIDIGLHPGNIRAIEKGRQTPDGASIASIDRSHGAGIAAQTIDYIVKNPDDLSTVLSSFEESHGRLRKHISEFGGSGARAESEEALMASRGVLAGVREYLDRTYRLSGDTEKARISKILFLRTNPEVLLLGELDKFAADNDQVGPIVRRLELMTAADYLQPNSPRWFYRHAFSLLSRAIHLQDAILPTPGSRGLSDLVDKLRSTEKDGESAVGVNLEHLVGIVNQAQRQPQLGLAKYVVSDFGPREWTIPVAIDRIVFMAMHQNSSRKQPGKPEALKIVSSLGHTARMFTEYGSSTQHTGMGKLTKRVDLQIRYPGLDAPSIDILARKMQETDSSLVVHRAALKLAKLASNKTVNQP